MGRGFTRIYADTETGGRGIGGRLERQLREAEPRAVLLFSWSGRGAGEGLEISDLRSQIRIR